MASQPTSASAAEDDVLIDAATLHRRLDGAHRPAVLDVRWALGGPPGRDGYLAGHIPSAVFVDLERDLAAPPAPLAGRHPLPSLADLQAAARRWGLRTGQAAVAYDDSGGLASSRAWWLLRWAGIEVRLLDGGLGAWKRSGFAVETGTPADPAESDVILSSGHLRVLSADDAAELARTGVLLDARAGERYRGEQEPIDAQAGHIPGARSAPTTANLTGEGTFADRSVLRDRFEGLGAAGGLPVGVYCGSGVTAAHEIAALQIVGVEAALYPGSWSAWSADPSRPVATGAEPGTLPA